MFLYYLTKDKGEEELFDFDKIRFFNSLVPNIYLTEDDVKINSSIFIKYKLNILAKDEEFSSLIKTVKELPLDNNKHKVVFLKNDNVENRQDYIISLAYAISGTAEFKNPNVIYGLAYYNNMYYFGLLEERKKDKFKSLLHSYSNSCTSRLAWFLSTLAKGRVLDPCCGVGTIALHLLDNNFDVVLNDINRKIATQAKENLQYFGYNLNVTTYDIAAVSGKYDTLILDMPYNHFTQCSEEDKEKILTNALRLSDYVIILATDDQLQFKNLKHKLKLYKNNFTRYVYILD